MKICLVGACAVVAAFSQICSGATLETISPASMFSARRINSLNVIVGGVPEGAAHVGSSVEIKEGTSDRGILEFDLRNRSRAVNVTLSMSIANLDVPRFTTIYLYAFKANGVANASDYFKTEKLITTFTDSGLADNSTPPYSVAFALDVTEAYNQSVANGDDYLGFLLKNTTTESQYARYRIISSPPGTHVPILTVTVPEPRTLGIAISACVATLIFARALLRQSLLQDRDAIAWSMHQGRS